MEEKKYCPHCGEELENNGYNYDNGHTYYYCNECDMEFNENTALDEDEKKEKFG